MIGALQGLVTMVQNFLGIPMGATVQKQGSGDSSSASKYNCKDDDFISSIVDITVDDVVIGSTPFFYTFEGELEVDEKMILTKIQTAFNDIAKWIARDLLTDGSSVYTIKIDGTDVYLYPVLGDIKFLINEKKRIIPYKDGKKIKDAVVYINFNKGCLSETDKKNVFEITPLPIQLAHVQNALMELKLIEKAILRYRRDASRVIQYATVDVGLSQGDALQDAIDKVSAPLNANSLTLEGTTADLFDDELPVIPTRREIGKPTIEQHVPTADISSMVDVDHVMSKLFLALKFPKSYADFTSESGTTAVSLVRGDIRYSRMILATVSLINKQTNEALQPIDFVRRKHVSLKLTQVPSPEDDEVIAALQSYSDFIEQAYGFIVGEADIDPEEVKRKAQMYKSLLGNAVNLKSIQQFLEVFKEYEKKSVADEKTADDIANEDIDEGFEEDLGDDLQGDGDAPDVEVSEDEVTEEFNDPEEMV